MSKLGKVILTVIVFRYNNNDTLPTGAHKARCRAGRSINDSELNDASEFSKVWKNSPALARARCTSRCPSTRLFALLRIFRGIFFALSSARYYFTFVFICVSIQRHQTRICGARIGITEVSGTIHYRTIFARYALVSFVYRRGLRIYSVLIVYSQSTAHRSALHVIMYARSY